MAAPINLGFEDQGTNPGEADGWTVVYVSTAVGLASFPIGPGQWQAVEDFEQGWDNDDFLLVFGLGDTEAAIFDQGLPSAQTFEDFEEGWGDYYFTGPPTADATFTFNEDVEDFEEQWNTVSATFTTSFVTDRLFSSNHGLTDGRVLSLTTTGSLPSPLGAPIRWYVINATTNDFQVAATPGGEKADIAPGGSGTHTWTAGHELVFETELSDVAEAEFDGGPATEETFEASAGWDAGYQTTLGSTAPASFGADLDDVEDFEDVKDVQTFTVLGSNNLFAVAHGFGSGDRVTIESTGTFPDGLSGAPLYYVRDVFPNTFKLELTSGGGAVTISDGGSGIHTVRADKAKYWTDQETF